MQRYAPALRGGGFELLLDYNWIIAGLGGLLLCGPWAIGGIVTQEVLVGFA